ncbi:hypothetical protein DFR59_102204 [Falsibacillus pallidus]|uniref:Uncharacterized protein n=1 Tax=Falsibacillus pallidus TaxID=493781 RepID=A0A370GQP7_9BACI|nr:hypothetical protein DFR59_102204 [Falsibacillus pallidus]
MFLYFLMLTVCFIIFYKWHYYPTEYWYDPSLKSTIIQFSDEHLTHQVDMAKLSSDKQLEIYEFRSLITDMHNRWKDVIILSAAVFTVYAAVLYKKDTKYSMYLKALMCFLLFLTSIYINLFNDKKMETIHFENEVIVKQIQGY